MEDTTEHSGSMQRFGKVDFSSQTCMVMPRNSFGDAQDVRSMGISILEMLCNGDVGSRSSVRFWITIVVGGARHTDPASDPKTRI